MSVSGPVQDWKFWHNKWMRETNEVNRRAEAAEAEVATLREQVERCRQGSDYWNRRAEEEWRGAQVLRGQVERCQQAFADIKRYEGMNQAPNHEIAHALCVEVQDIVDRTLDALSTPPGTAEQTVTISRQSAKALYEHLQYASDEKLDQRLLGAVMELGRMFTTLQAQPPAPATVVAVISEMARRVTASGLAVNYLNRNDTDPALIGLDADGTPEQWQAFLASPTAAALEEGDSDANA